MLDNNEYGVFVISSCTVFERKFDESCGGDFAQCSVCKYLNEKWLSEIHKLSGYSDSIFLSQHIDLTAVDGSFRFGCIARAGLLTFDGYRKYRDFIPQIDDDWWLATRASSVKCPKEADNVCFVTTDGVVFWEPSDDVLGVRPTLLLFSDILVDDSTAIDEKPNDDSEKLSIDEIAKAAEPLRLLLKGHEDSNIEIRVASTHVKAYRPYSETLWSV